MADSLTPQAALALVIELAGGPGAVGRSFDPPISSQAVSQWRIAPSARVRRLAELGRGRVSEQQLRPDIFGKPTRGRNGGFGGRAAA